MELPDLVVLQQEIAKLDKLIVGKHTAEALAQGSLIDFGLVAQTGLDLTQNSKSPLVDFLL